MPSILISDPTLRDGNHAIKHQLSLKQIARYAGLIDKVGVDIIEVGHGNGLGASSLQLGFSRCSDSEMLRCARQAVKNAQLGIHIIPGFGRIRDLDLALEEGVDVFRVASHCTEADTTKKYIEHLQKQNKTTYGVLMMTHMVDAQALLIQAKKMASYGAQGVILMDSAGAYLLDDVAVKVGTLVESLAIPVGFHAHNNLGLAVALSLRAAQAGATIIDGTAKGFGAGAGNTPIELLVAVLQRQGFSTHVDLYQLLDAVDAAQHELIVSSPAINSANIMSGLHGVFSGFDTHIKRVANEFKIDQKMLYDELGKRKIIAGQEDCIIEIALAIKKHRACLL